MDLAKTLQSKRSINLYVDIPEYKNPTMITGESQRPDFTVVLKNKLYILELVAGYETNIVTKSNREERNSKA